MAELEEVKKPVGRPTVMVEETVKKLEEAFAFGASDEEACFYADISKQTLYDYQKKVPEFIDRKEALKQRPILLARKTVVENLSKDADLSLKFLERKKKDEFSVKIENEISARPEEKSELRNMLYGKSEPLTPPRLDGETEGEPEESPALPESIPES